MNGNPDANDSAAVPVPSYLDDPSACLRAIATQGLSRELWGKLGGRAAAHIRDEASPEVATLYLHAVAQQMPAADIPNAASAANDQNNADAANNMEAELTRSQRFFEILDVSVMKICIQYCILFYYYCFLATVEGTVQLYLCMYIYF